MSEPRTIRMCRICGSRDLEPILSLGVQQLTGVFPSSPSEKLSSGPLTLCRCSKASGGCGLVQLQHSYDSAEMYGDNYGYRSSLNSSMVDHLRSVVSRLLDVVTVEEGDMVLDIGSNDGTTLSCYPTKLERVGIDPTAEKFSAYYPPDVHIIPDFFSARRFDSAFGGKKARIITSIAMLYDLDDPVEFARQVRSVMHDDGVWHFEQSYLPSMVETTGYDTICHEHVEYYALAQIEWIMREARLRLLEVELNDVNGGSFAVTVCKDTSRLKGDARSVSALRESEQAAGYDSIRPFANFAARVANHRAALIGLLDDLERHGNLVVGYGASTKGNVILQYCGIGPDRIPVIAEVNPEKFGRFTPGSGIPIVSETDAKAMKPDYLLAMPWHFRRNLLKREADYLRAGGKMIFPLPDIDIVAG